MSPEQNQEFHTFDQRAVIKVCGIGGGGGNSVDRMIEAELSGVQFIAINTDAQALKKSAAEVRVQIGTKSSGGLGAGANPEAGRAACEEDRGRVREVIEGADMVFLTLGLGGGTGTGAAPIVAQEATESGALVTAIVTLPFSFEGEERMNNALRGLEELEKHVDTLIVVPNDRIAELSGVETSFLEAFRKGDDVLHKGVRAITELITVTGLINLDFKDLRTIMMAGGRALMGIGVAEGEDRALEAAREAVICPLLEQSDINGAKGVIVNVRGGKDVRMQEVTEAIQFIRGSAPGANIIFGAVIEKEVRPDIQVTVIAAGFPQKDASEYRKPAATVVPAPAPAKPALTAADIAAAQRPQPAAPAAVSKPDPAPAAAPEASKAGVKPTAPQAPQKNGPPPKPGEQLVIPTAPDGFRPVFTTETPADKKHDTRIPAFMRKNLESGNRE